MDQLNNGIRDLNPGDILPESEGKLRSHLTSFLKDRMTRRELLKVGGLSGLSLSALWSLACRPAAPAPTPTKAPVAVAPTPTKPAVPAAPTPTKPPAPTPTPEAKIGKALIGKLEGPEVITDVAKYPKAFKEAPGLAELVKAGKLPPVKERIGEDPLVLKPVHEIGKYGGTWRRGFTGPGDWYGVRRAATNDSLLYHDYAITKLVPNIARGWETSADGRTTTIFLRRGMKWADGQPFTADDLVFWYEDMYLNKDLVPTPSPAMASESGQGKVEKVDIYTVRFKFPDPNYLFPESLSPCCAIDGHGGGGRGGMGIFAPAHYLKQFHPKYVSKEELDKKVKEGKFDNWVSLIKFKNSWDLNPELPVVMAWRTTTPANTPTFTLERNPYSIWVDTEGNQLPYLDKVISLLAENLEVLNLRAIAGEYDFQERHTDIQKLPVYLANQAKGGYKVYLDPSDESISLRLNQSYEGDAEVAKWLTNRDFRRALSLGIEREQINETFWLGTGEPGSIIPADTNPESPGPEYRTLWSTYDPKKANEMLDKIGLDKKDGEGYRLRTDGKGRLRLEVLTISGQFVPFGQICEMIREHWKKIGIWADVKELERLHVYKLRDANDFQILMDRTDGPEQLAVITSTNWFPTTTSGSIAPLYGVWFASGGKKGKEPPASIRQMLETWKKARGGRTSEERIKLTREIWKILVEEQWAIGIVGVSAAITGVRVVKTAMGNIPSRMINSGHYKTPGLSQPATFYFKGLAGGGLPNAFQKDMIPCECQQ